MWARFKAAWRTPVPPLVKVVAIAAVLVVVWLDPPWLVGLPPPTKPFVGFAVGITTVLVVLLGWQAILWALTPRPTKPASIPIVERNEAVAALVERCGRITPDEAAALFGSWFAAEEDPIASAAVAEGWRLARQAGPDADKAADAADWAFRWTLEIPSDGALYADNNPFHGRAIRAIRAHAAAVVAGDEIPADLARALSGPWREAMDPV